MWWVGFREKLCVRASAVVNHMISKQESFGYFLLGLASVSLTWLAPKATALGEMTQNNGHYAVQGHSWYQWKARCDFL